MSAPFVSPEFEVPISFAGPGFRLEPLGAVHNERDHVAWMTSIAHIKATPGFEGSDWPEPMSLEANMSDLVQHSKEFEDRTAFAYSMLDGDEVIGCLYVNPTTAPDHDALVTSWVRESRAALDAVVWQAVSEWLAVSWPFADPEYAPRGLG